MRSIASRLLIGNGIILAGFVVLTALAVSWSVKQRAETARFERLQGMIYGILGATEISPDGQLIVDESALPERLLNQSTSGLYAELVGFDGDPLWQSRSSVVRQPKAIATPVGEWLFERLTPDKSMPAVDRLQLQSIWELDSGEELPFIVHVADERQSIGRELALFDRALWISLAGVALVLLVLQTLLLKKGLAPLQQLGKQVEDVERGHRDALDTDLPAEIAPLAGGLNALLASERGRQLRFRNLLDDLAHSLKTPLSILANMGDSERQNEADTGVVREQTDRMRASIDRSLQRATRQNATVLAPSLAVRPVVGALTRSLLKLYGSRRIDIDNRTHDTFRVRVADTDLHEILGNVLENACKYGATRIIVTSDHPDHAVIVDDDGPGFPVDADALMQRGIRADTRQDGQGLGLAASRELVEGHGGSLSLGRSPLGGARVRLTFPRVAAG